jgi:hypothetical protein
MNRICRYVPALLVCLACLYGADAEAKCAYPTIKLSVTAGERGTVLTVTGENFWRECVDEGPAPLPPREPARRIQIVFKQDNRSTVLATVDADDKFAFTARIAIPVDASIGKANLAAVGEFPLAAVSTTGVKLYEAEFQVTATPR